MKKINKILFAFLAFFSFTLTSFAKNMTISEIGEEIEKVKEDETTWAYVIGDYVFTSLHNLSVQDVMLASSSLKVSKENEANADAMTIYIIEKDEDTGVWKSADTFVGKNKLDDKALVNIRYIDYNFIKSESEIELDINTTEYKSILQKDFAYQGNNKSLRLSNDGKLTGVVEYHPEINEKYGSSNAKNYFFAYVLKVKNATENTVINATLANGTVKKITWEDFDKQKCDANSYCEVLLFTALDKDSNKKALKVTIDNGEDYDLKSYTIDYSDVVFQTISNVNGTASYDAVTKSDKDIFKDWGYNASLNKNISYNNNELTGTIVEQTLNKDIVFGKDKKTGYYFTFTFQLPANITPTEGMIKRIESSELTSKVIKSYQVKEYSNGTLTILFRIDPKDIACTTRECKYHFLIDYDVDGDAYLPQLFTLDYSKVIFEEASLFSIDNIEDESLFTNALGWQKLSGYESTFSVKGENLKTLQVAGLLPIFKDEKFTSGKPNELKDTQNYYLGFVIHTNKNLAELDNMQLEIEGGNFVQQVIGNDIYVLKYLNPSTSGNKDFDVTLDLDSNAEKYAPYTININWENIKFQKESLGSKASVAGLDLKTQDKEELATYEYNADLVNAVIKNNVLTGTVKEQQLNLETSGFKPDAKYFVPIKITFPKDLYPNYAKSWTITVKTEDGADNYITPHDYDYEAGYVMVLFRIDPNKDKIEYELDYDGKNGNEFLPQKYTINYTTGEDPETSLVFKSRVNVTLEKYYDATGKLITEDVVVFEGDTFAPTLTSPDKYHLSYEWYKGEDKFTSETITKDEEDFTLTAHWKIDIDTYVDEIVTKANKVDQLILSKEENNITAKVEDSTLTINDTILAKTILDVLTSKNVKNIKVTLDSKFIDLNAANLDAIKSSLANLLSEYSTLDDLATSQKQLILNITLNDNYTSLDNNEYKILFTSDVAKVTSEATLKQALQNSHVTHIDILNSFSVNEQYTISKNITINGHDNTLSSSQDINSIFNITSNVTLNNIKFSNTKIGVIVTNGILTVDNLELKDGIETAGIEVKAGATLNATNLTYENEKYLNPAIITDKDNGAIVNLTYDNGLKASKITKQLVVTYEQRKAKNEENIYGDRVEIDNTYNHYNYYSDPVNSQIYEMSFTNMEGSFRTTFTRYTYAKERPTAPNTEDVFKDFAGFNYEQHVYTLLGYSLNSNDSTIASDGSCQKKDSIYAIDNLPVATKNVKYFTAYCIKEKEGASTVKQTEHETYTQNFKTLLANPEIKEIYIPEGVEIDLSNEILTINRAVSIYGGSDAKRNLIKVRGIDITAPGVFMQRLKIEGLINEEDNRDSIIDVKFDVENATKLMDFSLWQCNVYNNGFKVKYAVNYETPNKARVDIRYNSFNGDNISNGYINITNNLSSKSDIYGNTFNELKSLEEGSKSAAIIVNGFTHQEEATDIARIEANTYRTSYALKVLTGANNNTAKVELFTSSNITVAIEYELEEENNYGGINFIVKNLENINFVYIAKGTNVEEEMAPQSLVEPQKTVYQG